MRNKKIDKRNLLFNTLYCIGKVLEKIVFQVDIQGLGNLPSQGRFIICPNHTSNFDPVIMLLHSNRIIHFLAKEELIRTRFLKWFFNNLYVIPVKRNSNDTAAIKKCLRILKDEKVLGIFPEGTTKKEGRELIEPKAGAVSMAIASKTPVIPVAIYGKYKFRGKIYIKTGQPIYFDEYYSKVLKR